MAINDLFGERKMKTVQDIRETILMAGTRRIRPCMMTAVTTFIGIVPILGSNRRWRRGGKTHGDSFYWWYGYGAGQRLHHPLSLNVWHKEHKLKKALKKDPGVAETGMII